MDDLISRQAAIDIKVSNGINENGVLYVPYGEVKMFLESLPSAQPDFSCEGCQTPKHICGICMRNYPNITDHYTGGEAG